MEGMQAIVETLESIDENSQKIYVKHFDQAQVNILGLKAPDILTSLEKLATDAQDKSLKPIDSDDIKSDSSGNQSDNDEMNQIVEIQKLVKIIEKRKQGEINSEMGSSSAAETSYVSQNSAGYQLDDIQLEHESNHHLMSDRRRDI